MVGVSVWWLRGASAAQDGSFVCPSTRTVTTDRATGAKKGKCHVCQKVCIRLHRGGIELGVRIVRIACVRRRPARQGKGAGRSTALSGQHQYGQLQLPVHRNRPVRRQDREERL